MVQNARHAGHGSLGVVVSRAAYREIVEMTERLIQCPNFHKVVSLFLLWRNNCIEEFGDEPPDFSAARGALETQLLQTQTVAQNILRDVSEGLRTIRQQEGAMTVAPMTDAGVLTQPEIIEQILSESLE